MSRTSPLSAARRPVSPARDRAGFTLIELLVALMISGLLVGVIFQLMQGQGRYVAFQSARQEVQQNARAAVELIGGELRGVPGQGGVVRADADSLTMRVPRIWGVVCAVPATGGSTIDLAVPVAAGLNLAPQDSTGVVVAISAAGVSNRAWVTAVAAPSATCGTQTLPAQSAMRRVTYQGQLFGSSQVPRVGDPAYLFDQVTYRSGRSQGIDGLWIQRRSGGSGNQPFAGPIVDVADGERGIRFEYLDAAGASLPVPVTNPDLIRTVRLTVRTLSESASKQSPQLKSDTVVVSLRNRS